MSTDPLSPAERSERMRRVRSKDTKPEMVVRRLVHALGYRYRLHSKSLPGKPDLIFAGRRKVIFVHGCFWHRHDENRCALTRWPKSRLEFWEPKLLANKRRDGENQTKLNELGWRFFIVWECELRDRAELTRRIVEFLEESE
jgi:DNA mismatch endonuclease, patch repair protein